MNLGGGGLRGNSGLKQESLKVKTYLLDGMGTVGRKKGRARTRPESRLCTRICAGRRMRPGLAGG